MENADTPEGVELSLALQTEGMVSLTVRSIYADTFAALVGSCIQAADRKGPWRTRWPRWPKRSTRSSKPQRFL